MHFRSFCLMISFFLSFLVPYQYMLGRSNSNFGFCRNFLSSFHFALDFFLDRHYNTVATKRYLLFNF